MSGGGVFVGFPAGFVASGSLQIDAAGVSGLVGPPFLTSSELDDVGG